MSKRGPLDSWVKPIAKKSSAESITCADSPRLEEAVDDPDPVLVSSFQSSSSLLSSSTGHQERSQAPSPASPRTPSRIKTTQASKTTSSRDQKYRKVWEQEAAMKGWLRCHPTDTSRALCIMCNQYLEAKRSVLLEHSERQKHIRNMMVLKSGQSSMESFAKQGDTTLTQQVQNAELMICAFVATHGLSFLAMDHLSPLLPLMFPDSSIAKNVASRRTKTKSIIVNALGTVEKQIMVEKLKKSKFSVLIDESTDIASVKTCCIIVRFFDEEVAKITSKFWDLCQLFSEDDPESAAEGATAQRIFHLVISSFQDKEIPNENIIGFASDGASVMMGSRNSVASRFRQLCPGIYIFKCICHSLHLVASEACKSLPTSCEDLARNVYAFFKSSSKRMAQFAEFQQFVELEPLKMLHPAQTRWLSLRAVVQRILKYWTALRLFFDSKWIEEKLSSAETIHNALHDKWIKAYFLFLDYVLRKIVSLNEQFQSDKVIITELHAKMTEMYRELLQCFIQRSHTTRIPLHILSPDDKSMYLPLEQVYLGVGVVTHVNENKLYEDKPRFHEFIRNCRNFLIIACNQTKLRYDFSDDIMHRLMPCLRPEAALSQHHREKVRSLLHLLQLIPRVVPKNIELLQDLDDQWRRLPDAVEGSLREELLKMEPDTFWNKVRHLGGDAYKVLADVALEALSLPHSNAQCERLFSEINNIKTKPRNRLITSTVRGVLLARQHIIRDRQRCCVDFEPTAHLRSMMTSRNLYGAGASARSLEEEENAADDDEDIFRYAGLE